MNDTRFDFKYLRSRRIFPSALVKCAFITLPLVVGGGIFRGKVQSENPLVPPDDKKRFRVPPSEHDPEWHVASVLAITPLRGGAKDTLVTIIFPASRDIMWFNSPKLHPGMEAIFIAHRPEREQDALLRATGVTAFMQKQPAELVTQPFDVLPLSDEQRVRRLLP